jgi:5-methyltetrahydrofolate--homocysteine methyltransferase
MVDLAALALAIEAGDRATAVRITTEAVNEGTEPQVVLEAMTQAMGVIGGRFQRNEIYVPEMLIAARAMKEATAILEPVLVAADIRPEHTAVIGTIRGDLHDIGKNLVAMMWKGANIAVIDLGTNVAPERFAEAAAEHGARLVGVSALLTTTMVGMREARRSARRGQRPADHHDGRHAGGRRRCASRRPRRRQGDRRRGTGDRGVCPRHRGRRLRGRRRLGGRGGPAGTQGMTVFASYMR